jgi:centrosomal CEP192-like protein/immunoglobulin I-set domain protein
MIRDAQGHLQTRQHKRSIGSKPFVLSGLVILLCITISQSGCIGLTGASPAATSASNTASATAPVITSQPASEMVTIGQTATFSVSAIGAAPLGYQWQKNGTAVGGATSSTYTTPATALSDTGVQFTVVVNNSVGSVTSSAATLTVTSSPVAPSITTQPVNQAVAAGQTATFSVAATGTAPLSYQWKKSGIAIGGATSTSYTTPATTSSDNGAQFVVVVSNSVGSATSRAATLTVNTTPGHLSTSPSSLNFGNVSVGSSSTLGVTFTNTGPSNVNILNASMSGPGFSASGVSGGLIITPGMAATLNVAFAPASSGSVTGGVTVTSNATNSTIVIPLSGSGVVPLPHSASLSWTGSTSVVVGYYAYRGTASGGPYLRLNASADASTNYTDTTVQAGLTYYYVVTAVDSSNLESVFSNQVSATVPTP